MEKPRTKHSVTENIRDRYEKDQYSNLVLLLGGTVTVDDTKKKRAIKRLRGGEEGSSLAIDSMNVILEDTITYLLRLREELEDVRSREEDKVLILRLTQD